MVPENSKLFFLKIVIILITLKINKDDMVKKSEAFRGLVLVEQN